MFLESETDLTLTLGIIAVAAVLAAVFFLFLLTRTAAALASTRKAHESTEVVADRTEQRMFTILQAIPVALVETDTSGKFTFANRAAHQLLGRKDSELLGLRFHSATWGITYPDGRLIPPDLLPAARALRGQTVKGFQHMMVNPNSRKKMLVSVTAMPIMNDLGEVIGSSSAIVETETLSTPQADPEELLRSRYFEVAGVMLLALDRGGLVKDINTCGAEILGAAVHEIIGKDWIKDFLPLEDQKEARAFFDGVIAGTHVMPAQGEGWIVRADGTRRLISWRGSVLTDERDRIAGALSSGLDLTESRAAEEALRTKEHEAVTVKAQAEAQAQAHEGKLSEATRALKDSETQFEGVADAFEEALYMYDPAERRVIYVNKAYETLWGDDRQKLLDDPTRWRAIVHPDDIALVAERFDKLNQGESGAIEFRITRPSDNQERILCLSTFAVRGEDGAIRRLAGVTRDVTDERRAGQELAEAHGKLERHAADLAEAHGKLEQHAADLADAHGKLEQHAAETEKALEESTERNRKADAALSDAQRFETVGRLTGGVAHDFSAMLTVVTGALDMMLAQSDKPDRVKRLGEAALAATRRGERLTRQLMAFSQGESFKLEALELEPVIRGFEPMLRRALDGRQAIDFDLDPHLGRAVFDAAHLEAALINLIDNAKDATAEVGAVSVRADRVHLNDGEVADAKAGDYARVSVVDTGAGMAPEIAARAFEPFFTTKQDGGTGGLGLAQVYAFARQAGGGVGIKSAPGAGSTVSIYLPLLADDVAAPVMGATAANA